MPTKFSSTHQNQWQTTLTWAGDSQPYSCDWLHLCHLGFLLNWHSTFVKTAKKPVTCLGFTENELLANMSEKRAFVPKEDGI